MKVPLKSFSWVAGLALGAVLLAGLVVGSAEAALIPFSFSGAVTSTQAPLAPTINLLSPVSGTFQFQDATPGVGGIYPGAVTGLTLNIGSYTASFTAGANSIEIVNNGFGIGDRWRLVTATTGLPLNGFTPFRFDLNLVDENGLALNSTALQNPPSLASLTSARWRLMFENDDLSVRTIQGSLTALVPLPASILLFGGGLIGLAGLGAGGLRNMRRTQA